MRWSREAPLVDRPSKQALGGGSAGADAGRDAGAAVRRARHRDLRRQRGLDALDALEMADGVLRDRGAEAPDAQVDRRVTQPECVRELLLDRRRQLAIL